MPMTSGRPTIDELGDRIGPLIVRQFETLCRALLRGPDVEQTPAYCRIVTGAQHPLGNFAVVSDQTDAAALDAAIAPLLELTVPTAAILTGPESPDAAARLDSAEYVLAESMPAMAVDLDAVAPAPLPQGCAFHEIEGTETDAWNEALAAGYELPPAVAERFGPGAVPRDRRDLELRYFTVRAGEMIVATSTLMLEGGLAGIYCVSTRPEHRGRGLGAAATAEPLRIARDLGYRTGILQSSAMGEPVYRRLGFSSHGAMPLYVRMP